MTINYPKESDEVDKFIDELKESVRTKSYPTCDTSLSYDLTLGIIASREFEEYEDEIIDVVEDGLKKPIQILEFSEDTDPNDVQPEVVAFAISVHAWREATATYGNTPTERIKGGKIINKYIESDDPDEAVEFIQSFENQCFDHVRNDNNFVEEFRSDYPNIADEVTNTKELVIYASMLFTVHRKLLGEELTDVEMRVP